jgi:hypothetical protein
MAGGPSLLTVRIGRRIKNPAIAGFFTSLRMRELLEQDRFRGAVSRGVFDRIFEIGGDGGIDHFRYILAHFENLGDAVRTQSACGAKIRVNSYRHG